MKRKNAEEIRAALESLGWQCHESSPGYHWTVVVRRAEEWFLSRGMDRKQVWLGAYREAVRRDAG